MYIKSGLECIIIHIFGQLRVFSLKINSEVNFLTDASITAFPPDSLRWLLFLR